MIRLRPYKSCDAAKIAGWIKDEFAFRQWSADRYESYPISPGDINSYYSCFADSDAFFAMTAFDENGIAGHLTMRFTDDEKSVLRFGFVIVDDSKRGVGLGKEMLSLSLKYSFEILKVKTVTLGVFENNSPAYYCYKSVGFKELETDQFEYYNVLNERWKCLEMKIDFSDYENIYMR